MSYFTSEKVTDRITRVHTPFGVCIYLVEGKEGALLLDTGMGCGDLKAYIDSICDKPLKVLLSHGHCDHAGGSAQFDDVYLPSADLELEKYHCALDKRIAEIKNGPVPPPQEWRAEDMIPSRVKPYKELSEGMVFNIGEVSVEIIEVPGHTQGQLVFLIREEKTAIFGDACGVHTLLHFPESTTIKEYYQHLLHLKQFESAFDRILRFHGTFESPKVLLENNIQLCERILNGTDDKIAGNFHGVKCLIARIENTDLAEDEVGNIMYKPDRIR
ncbi:MBL fold metallo-hydrolase [Paraliobacillus zengyii]|uniref:MBL fold metallo-hydrolase n=1 Tax=Paraliobacillus zengyii TaxID=2213194 RepID=UPI000DD2B9BD|nr:MBL fold metallo-hydrolase [Paraliobacillus zengyii]